jgi:hypothetical protein
VAAFSLVSHASFASWSVGQISISPCNSSG